MRGCRTAKQTHILPSNLFSFSTSTIELAILLLSFIDVQMSCRAVPPSLPSFWISSRFLLASSSSYINYHPA